MLFELGMIFIFAYALKAYMEKRKKEKDEKGED